VRYQTALTPTSYTIGLRGCKRPPFPAIYCFAGRSRVSASTPGPPPFSLGARAGRSKLRHENARVAHWLKTLLSSCVRRLAKSDALAAGPALLDEFNASIFKSMSYRRFVSKRNLNFPVNDLDAADRCDPNLAAAKSRAAEVLATNRDG
jgi:hypothetical protein